MQLKVLTINGCSTRGFRQNDIGIDLYKDQVDWMSKRKWNGLRVKVCRSVLQGKISTIEADRQKKGAKFYLDLRVYRV